MKSSELSRKWAWKTQKRQSKPPQEHSSRGAGPPQRFVVSTALQVTIETDHDIKHRHDVLMRLFNLMNEHHHDLGRLIVSIEDLVHGHSSGKALDTRKWKNSQRWEGDSYLHQIIHSHELTDLKGENTYSASFVEVSLAYITLPCFD
jgi:hypothetical protein